MRTLAILLMLPTVALAQETAPEGTGQVVIVEHQPDQEVQQPPPPPQQGYGQPQPVYQQPVYQQPQAQPRLRRYRDPYVEGMEMPEGAVISKRVRLGLLIPGAALFLVPYISTAITFSTLRDTRSSARQPQGILLVPVLGPFLGVARLDENFEDMGRDSGSRRGLLIWDGVLQLAGLTMAIFGAIPKKYVTYYAGSERGIRVTPRFAGGPGLDLSARF